MIDDMTAAAAPRPATYGCGSLRQTAAIITRTALAYSNIRRIRWWLAYLDLPILWLLTSTPIVRRPDLIAWSGTASAQLDHLPAAAGAPTKPRGHSLLVAAAIALLAALVLGPIPVLALLGPTSLGGAFTVVWYLLLIVLPVLTWAVPSSVQQWRGRGRRDWATATAAQTGRQPVLFTELAAWPAKGGGQPGTGDGFNLVKAIAHDAALDGGILIATARSAKLARKYCAQTGAVASPTNSRLLRWP